MKTKNFKSCYSYISRSSYAHLVKTTYPPNMPELSFRVVTYPINFIRVSMVTLNDI